KVGPKTILFAPPVDQGRAGWEYVSPNAATIKEVAASVERITEDFRRLAMQPTVQKTGNITATATAVDASKAHSTVESWAIALGIVSKKTVRGEWKRTGVLGPDFNEDEEELRLSEEQQGLEPEEPINPVNGEVVP